MSGSETPGAPHCFGVAVLLFATISPQGVNVGGYTTLMARVASKFIKKFVKSVAEKH